MPKPRRTDPYRAVGKLGDGASISNPIASPFDIYLHRCARQHIVYTEQRSNSTRHSQLGVRWPNTPSASPGALRQFAKGLAAIANLLPGSAGGVIPCNLPSGKP